MQISISEAPYLLLSLPVLCFKAIVASSPASLSFYTYCTSFASLFPSSVMASVTQSQATAPHLLSSVGNNVAVADSTKTSEVPKGRDVTTTFNYFKDTADGLPPAPSYVNRPSSYFREYDNRQQVVHDIRGTEDQYTLDTTGFEIYKHESVEKEFADDEQIKRVYYPEVEELLKKA